MSRQNPFILTLISVLGLSACNISTPFRGPEASIEPGQTVYVGITHAVLKAGAQSRSLFFDYVEKVEKSLPRNAGFLGFSKRMALFGNDAWTMSVWVDEASLDAFVQSDPHQEAIRNAINSLESARFARVEISAEDAPLSWDRVLEVLESKSRSY